MRYTVMVSRVRISYSPPTPKTLHFCRVFWCWRRVTKELFSSRVGSADIRRGSPALRETALSLTLNTQNLSPAFLRDFCVLAESKERTLQFACRLCRHTPRVSRLAGNGVISYSQYSKPIPRIKCGIFCALAGA